MPENENSYKSIVGIDPNIDWYLRKEGLGFRSLEENPIIPMIITLYDDDSVAEFKSLLGKDNCPIGLFCPDVDYLNGVFSIDKDKPIVAFTTKQFFDDMRNLDDYDAFRSSSKEIKISAPIPSSLFAKGFLDNNSFNNSVTLELFERFSPKEKELPEGSVIMGVIDDGIAIANDIFATNTEKTRIEYFLHMDKVSGGTPPFAYGSVMNKIEIDDLVTACTSDGELDEDKFYRLAGLADFTNLAHKPVSMPLAHGTHVLDIATGENPETEIKTRPIVAVQLPVKAVEEMSKEELDANIFMGVLFILLCTSRMTIAGKSPPIVINISYGYYGGPHDGTGPLEIAFDALIGLFAPNLKIVLPAGNGNLARCHAEFSVGESGTQNLKWTIEPDDFTDNKLSIWLPVRLIGIDGKKINLSLTAPDGTNFGPFSEKEISYSEILAIDGKEIGQLYFKAQTVPKKRGVFFVNLEPSMAHTSDGSVPITAPFGVWIFNVGSDASSADQEIMAWIDRDETLHGYPIRGRQSYFSNECYEKYDAQGKPIYEDSDPPDCLVRRLRMTNGLATGGKVFVVGGFRYRELDNAPYSAGGTFSSTTKKPDASLLSDISHVHTGMLATGSRRGSVIAMNGTSVAAPLLARTVADFLGNGESVDRAVIKDKAMLSEAGLPPHKPANSSDRGGWGRWTDVSESRIDSSMRVFGD
jgi:hypothetical protein